MNDDLSVIAIKRCYYFLILINFHFTSLLVFTLLCQYFAIYFEIAIEIIPKIQSIYFFELSVFMINTLSVISKDTTISSP